MIDIKMIEKINQEMLDRQIDAWNQVEIDVKFSDEDLEKDSKRRNENYKKLKEQRYG